jgi:hypothetical protein
MANGRCRLHGGKSTGPRTAAGLERCRSAHWIDGRYSQETLAEKHRLRALLREANGFIRNLGKAMRRRTPARNPSACKLRYRFGAQLPLDC